MGHTRFERMIMHLVRYEDRQRKTKIIFHPMVKEQVEVIVEDQTVEERIEMFKMLKKYLGEDEFFDLYMSVVSEDYRLISDHVMKDNH